MPATIYQGETVTITVTVRNDGGQTASGPFEIMTADFFDPAYTLPVGAPWSWTESSGLAPGQQQTYSVPYTAGVAFPVGPLYFLAVADILDDVAESNEANNTATAASQIVSPPPDLAVTITDVESYIQRDLRRRGLPISSPLKEFGDFWVDVTVTNLGAGSSPATDILPGISDITGSWGEFWPSRVVPGLAPGQSFSTSLLLNMGDLPVVPAGYYMQMWVDTADLIWEADESNNYFEVSISVQ
ncbi:MAG: hypothetical protein IH935_11850 [Acidobacteria bacterium]|nr:hypothetical protein [Acidobacteriota bacterium]